jgi:hypothetical protein
MGESPAKRFKMNNTKQHKGTMSVSKATLKAFEESEQVIYAPLFCSKVKQILGRPMCMDGTILRKLRELRAKGLVNYTCSNSEASIYRKC